MKNHQQVKYVVSYISPQLHWQLHFYQCLCETHQKDEVESSQNPPGIYCMIINDIIQRKQKHLVTKGMATNMITSMFVT